MHQYNSHMGYIPNREDLLKKQIKEDLAYFDDLKKRIEAEKKVEAQYINDRILRMKAKIDHMKDDIEIKQKEFLNIQDNKDISIHLERDVFVKQQEQDRKRVLEIRDNIKNMSNTHDHYTLNKLKLIFNKEKENYNLSVKNNIRTVKIRLKELNNMIESNKNFIDNMYQDILNFQEKELIAITNDKEKHNKKFNEKFKLAEETKNATIKESQSQLDSIIL